MYHINPKILQTPIADGKILLLEPKQGLYFELNEVSVVIFECLKEGMDSASTVAKVVENFAVSHEVAESDMLALIQQLKENNILIN